MTLDQLNALADVDFVATLAGIYEHSPWVAEAVLPQRPFADRADLQAALAEAVAQAGAQRQLALICAHPELAGKAAIRGELTAASTREQAGAGLDRCSAEEYARLQALNAAYLQRYQMPFILAVRGHTRASILAAMEARLGNTPDEERLEALRQIDRIAEFRLQELLG